MHNARTVWTVAVLLAAAGFAEAKVEPFHFGAAKARQAVSNRRFTGIPSLCVTPRGRLWATRYAGPTPAEDRNNYIVAMPSSQGNG